MPERSYWRTRICPDCGDVAQVRKDSPAVRCLACQRKARAALGHATKVVEGFADRECEVCGQPFTVYNCSIRHAREVRGINRGRFCSNACKGEWMRGKRADERT